jgi:hypothetical protein
MGVFIEYQIRPTGVSSNVQRDRDIEGIHSWEVAPPGIAVSEQVLSRWEVKRCGTLAKTMELFLRVELGVERP